MQTTPTRTSDKTILAFMLFQRADWIQVLSRCGSRAMCVNCAEYLGSRSQNCLPPQNSKGKQAWSGSTGRWIYYSLNLPQFVILEQYLAAEYRRPL